MKSVHNEFVGSKFRILGAIRWVRISILVEKPGLGSEGFSGFEPLFGPVSGQTSLKFRIFRKVRS